MPNLYLHPRSAFCQKVMVVLYEKGIEFEPIVTDLFDPDTRRLDTCQPTPASWRCAIAAAMAAAAVAACDPPPDVTDGVPDIEVISCNPALENQNCGPGTQFVVRIQCDAAALKWRRMSTCGSNQACDEVPDPAAPSVSTRKLAVCRSVTRVTDVVARPPKEDVAVATCPFGCKADQFCFGGKCQDACLDTCFGDTVCIVTVAGKSGKCEKATCKLPTTWAPTSGIALGIEVPKPADVTACDLTGDGAPDAAWNAAVASTNLPPTGPNPQRAVLEATGWQVDTAPGNVRWLPGWPSVAVPCSPSPTAGSVCGVEVAKSGYDQSGNVETCPAKASFVTQQASGSDGYIGAAAAGVKSVAVPALFGNQSLPLAKPVLRIVNAANGAWAAPFEARLCGAITLAALRTAALADGADANKWEAVLTKSAALDMDTDGDAKPDAWSVVVRLHVVPAKVTGLVK
ncbi:MAG: hypothetical protein EXR79_11745 [Myxococcales bacterium]|nr:hypothetical protein [Myxococcales bacterium]